MNEVVPTAQPIVKTASYTLPPLIERAAKHAVEKAKSIVINSDEGYAVAQQFGVDCRDEKDRLDADRLKQTKSMRDAIEDANENFRAPIALFQQAMETTRTAMNRWVAKKRELQDAENRRIEQDRQQREREAAEARERELTAQREAADRAREAAEAETARARAAEEAAQAAQRAAELAAQGSTEEAEKAQQEANTAKADAANERAKAKEAMKAKIRAEEEARIANERAEAAAKHAAPAVPTGGMGGGLRVGGKPKGVRTTYKWNVKPGAEVPRSHLMVDAQKVQLDVDRLKERAGEVLPWLEVTAEENATLRRKA